MGRQLGQSLIYENLYFTCLCGWLQPTKVAMFKDTAKVNSLSYSILHNLKKKICKNCKHTICCIFFLV